MDEIIIINFPKHQKLPDGYNVVWMELVERFLFTTPDKNFESPIYCDRYIARRACLKQIESNKQKQ